MNIMPTSNMSKSGKYQVSRPGSGVGMSLQQCDFFFPLPYEDKTPKKICDLAIA